MQTNLRSPHEFRNPKRTVNKKFSSKKNLTAAQTAQAKADSRKELKKLEIMMEALKLDYEQYFLGNIIIRPDQAHKEVKKQIRTVRKAPFKKPWVRYKLRMLEARYNIYNDYWQRTIRQKEEGTYIKDIFKAELKEKNKQAEAKAQTATGKVAKQVEVLFDAYKRALEQQNGRKINLDFNNFQKTIKAQAQAFKAQHADSKLGFKIVVNNGKVSIKARAI